MREIKQYVRCVEACCRELRIGDRLHGARVLVTGASGLIGSHLVEVLLCRGGIDVFACGRRKDQLEARFGAGKGRLRLVAWDAAEPLPEGLPEFHYVIHAAGGAHPAAFAGDPVGVMEANFLGTRSLLHHMRKTAGGRFVLLSSGEVYGQGGEGTAAFDEDACGEIPHTDPRACYPVAKRAAETLCAAFSAEYGVRGVIVRPCHVYGPTQTDGDSRASAQFLRSAAAGRAVVMQSDGSQVRSYCHVSDCVRGIVTCMLDGEDGKAYNIADRDGVVSIRQLAGLCAGAGGVRLVRKPPEQGGAAGCSRVTRAVLDASRLEALGWRAVVPLREGIASTVEILRARGHAAPMRFRRYPGEAVEPRPALPESRCGEPQ